MLGLPHLDVRSGLVFGLYSAYHRATHMGMRSEQVFGMSAFQRAEQIGL